MTLAITNALGTIHSSFSCLPPFSLLLPPSSPLNSAGWLTGLLRALVAGRIKRWYKKRLKGHRKQWLLKGGVGGGWWWWQEQSTAPRASSNSQSGGAASGHLSLCIICRRWSILWWPWGQGRGTIWSKRRWYSPKQRLENYPSASAAINKLQSLFFFTWLFAQVALFNCEITALFQGGGWGWEGVGNIWKQQKMHCLFAGSIAIKCTFYLEIVFFTPFFQILKKKKTWHVAAQMWGAYKVRGKKVLTRWPEHQMALFSSRRWSPSYVITSIAHTCKVPCWNRWQTWQTADSSPIRSLNVSVAGGQEM